MTNGVYLMNELMDKNKVYLTAIFLILLPNNKFDYNLAANHVINLYVYHYTTKVSK